MSVQAAGCIADWETRMVLHITTPKIILSMCDG
jgi:hypothetical protein